VHQHRRRVWAGKATTMESTHVGNIVSRGLTRRLYFHSGLDGFTASPTKVSVVSPTSARPSSSRLEPGTDDSRAVRGSSHMHRTQSPLAAPCGGSMLRTRSNDVRQ